MRKIDPPQRAYYNAGGLRLGGLRRISFEGATIVLGQIAAVAGTLFGIRLLTELLDPATYGEVALGMTVATLIKQTITGPLANGVMRFYAPASEQGNLEGYLNTVTRLILSASGMIVLLAGVLTVGLVVTGRAVWIPIVIATCLYSLPVGLNASLNGIQNAARQRVVVAIHQGMDPWMRYILAATLIIWIGASSVTVISGYAIASFVVVVSQFIFLRERHHKDSRAADHGQWHEKILKFSWPFCTWGAFSWAQLASDRWALGLMGSTREVGLYVVLYQLGYYPISLLSGMLVQFLAPILYERVGDATSADRNTRASRLNWRLFGLTLVLTGFAFLVLLMFHGPFFRLFVAKKYEAVSGMLPWMVLAGGLFASGQTIALELMSKMETRRMLPVKLGTAVVGIAANFIGAYLWGAQGVVAALVLSSALYLIWITLLAARKVYSQPKTN